MATDKSKEFEGAPPAFNPAVGNDQLPQYPTMPQQSYPGQQPAYPTQQPYPGQQPAYPTQQPYPMQQPGYPVQQPPYQPYPPQQPGFLPQHPYPEYAPASNYPAGPPPTYPLMPQNEVQLNNSKYLNTTGAAVFACFVTCCCGWICGLFALIFAFVSKNYEGKNDMAKSRSWLKSSFICSVLGVVTGVVTIIIYVVYISTQHDCLDHLGRKVC